MSRRVYSPLSVSGCQLWLDARAVTSLFTTTAETTQCTNTSNVGRWKDLSGNARHCDQATATQFPLYQTAGLNSKASVRFDGVNDRLVSSAFTLAQPCTIVIVGYGSVAGGYYVDGTTGNSRVVVHDTGTTVGVYAGTAFITTPVANMTTPRFYLGHFNGASSFMRQNSTEGATGNAGAAVETAGLTIGDYGATVSGGPLNGDIAMVAAYNKALSTAEKSFLQKYCTERYGT